MSRPQFVQWARENALPTTIPDTVDDVTALAPLAPMIGDSRIVWCGESTHWIRDWIRFRVRLFQHLVEAKGFRTFVFETGLVESRIAHDYVLGKHDDWDRVVSDGFEWSFGLFEEWQDLIRWMRDYNDAQPSEHEKLRFYGMDGTGIWANASRAYVALRDFLKGVDEEATRSLECDLLPAVSSATLPNADSLSPEAWNALLGKATRLSANLERRRLDYVSASSDDEYDWARMYAYVGLRVLTTLAEASQHPLDEWPGAAFRVLWEGRDAAMTDQLMWIIDREGIDSGFVIGAANNHLQQAPMAGVVATIGGYMTSRLPRDQMVFIATESERSIRPGEAPPNDSLAAALGEVEGDSFALDLRCAPRAGAVAEWLRQPHEMRANHGWVPCTPSPSFDVLFFARQVELATLALPKSLMREPAPSRLPIGDLAGTYDVTGFMGMKVVFDLDVEDGELVVDATCDRIGEVYPPKRSRLFPIDDNRFACEGWPAVMTFHPAEAGERQSITVAIPGVDEYPGWKRES